jgi:hypothetical protein
MDILTALKYGRRYHIIEKKEHKIKKLSSLRIFPTEKLKKKKGYASLPIKIIVYIFEDEILIILLSGGFVPSIISL